MFILFELSACAEIFADHMFYVEAEKRFMLLAQSTILTTVASPVPDEVGDENIHDRLGRLAVLCDRLGRQ